MKSLLLKDTSIELIHTKWYRSLENANITLKKSDYKLTPTQNKRKLVYNKGIAINTNPIKFD